MNTILSAAETIVAIATPPGSGALGIVRLSGPRAVALAASLAPNAGIESAPANVARFVRLRQPDGTVLDEAVLTLFRAPRSFTREDVVELSCHGSPYILNRVVELLVAVGARPAQPGEFTQRAYLNGALDLAQAEAVADLIAARTAQGHRLAMSQLRGGVSHRLDELRQHLLDFAALLELELDFGEEDVEFADRAQLSSRLAQTQEEVQRLIGSFAGGNAVRQGIPTVIVGKPNAGKSTLLNRLLDDARAIVSNIPGTTRDVIEDSLMLGGYEFRLVDTAGLREATDSIEAEGIARSHARLRTAAIILYVYDATAEPLADARAYLATLDVPPDAPTLVLANKADLLSNPGAILPVGEGSALSSADGVDISANVLPFSAQHGTGLTQLHIWLVAQAERWTAPDVVLTHQRHAHALARAAEALAEVAEGLHAGLGQELLALDLRRALDALGEVTGHTTPDDVLTALFTRFCIGK